MANTKISNLTALGAAPATDDLLVLVDVSASETKKLTVANLIDAVEGNANTFTATQSISHSAANGLTITRPGNNPGLSFSDGTNTVTIVYRSGIGLGVSGTPFIPQVDDSLDLGTINFRWDDIFATNATIQTSDAQLKTDVVDCDLGWDFIRSLRPVRFRWAEQHVIDPDTSEEFVKPAGSRPHYGLIAQEVKAALDAQGVADFAGYIFDEDSGRHGLRYNELWAPLIAAVQRGADIIEALAERVATLEAQIEGQ